MLITLKWPELYHGRSIATSALPQTHGRSRNRDMSSTPRPGKPRLTLVTSNSASAGQVSGLTDRTPLDWSGLMARAQDGDRDAYRTLLRDMTPYLRAQAARCFRDPGDIEETVQDVLLTIHAVRASYDPHRPFGPWLLAIANRRIIDRLRRQARVRSRETEFLPGHETFLADRTNLDSQTTDSFTDQAALYAAIDKLPNDQREAIRLLKLKEMSLKEAATATGRSIASLKVATHRALKNLRRAMQHKSDQP
jgi:RNA polymerase sigma-70 factor (ECF subfamily)